MIDHYEIKIPSIIKAGETFIVKVFARDAGNALVNDDSTLVSLTSSSPEIQFDANGNDVYGEVGDAERVLLDGVMEIIAKDVKSPTFTISIIDGSLRTGDAVAAYNFNVILFGTDTMYRAEITTFEHQRFNDFGIRTLIPATPPVVVLPLDVGALLAFVEVA